ncbi:diguanylate cyclase domain-containing protein [Pseudomonas antarctica]|uniref:diguanylate cyclase domain-containing protein n=1 Tax=Pseudomonas antarctica TaxID=219572 RepID=UPI00387AFC87
MKRSRDVEQLLAANEQLVLGMLRIQSEVQAAEYTLNEIARAANIDELTNLPNRRELRARLQHAIEDVQLHSGSFALLFLDLNDLKLINDTLGHHLGDVLLIETAGCLTQCVQDGDTVARYGGDEFVILLAHCTSRDDALSVADKIISSLNAPKAIGDRQLRISISIGISLYPVDGTDAQSLIDSADAAMYRVKRDKPVASPLPRGLRQRMLHMREANGALVIAALKAQQLQTLAEATLEHEKFILAMVAHELRAPLAPLSLSAEMLERSDQRDGPRLHAIIHKQIEHLTRLVDDLVDVTRIGADKLHLTRKTLDLATVIQQAVDICEPAMNARTQVLELTLAPKKVKVEGDHLRLTQVFSNLLSNASKFTPTNGVIQLSLRVTGTWAQVDVSDTGMGISANALPIIFEPFIQDEHTVCVNQKGLGVGLTVVRELVEAHAGSVVAHSEGLGRGSCFTVRLPLS